MLNSSVMVMNFTIVLEVTSMLFDAAQDSSIFRPVINLITLFLILNALMLTFAPHPPPQNKPISKLRMKLCETNIPEHPVAENFFFPNLITVSYLLKLLQK